MCGCEGKMGGCEGECVGGGECGSVRGNVWV